MTNGSTTDALVVKRLQWNQDVRQCHIVFLSAAEAPRIEELAQRVDGLPILLVGDTDDLARRGATMNFRVDDNQVRFDVNREAATRARLKISPSLLDLARIVRSPGRPLAEDETHEFRSLSIKRKLMLITMLTSSLALLLASAGFLALRLDGRFRAAHERRPDDAGRNHRAEQHGGPRVSRPAGRGEILSALKAKTKRSWLRSTRRMVSSLRLIARGSGLRHPPASRSRAATGSGRPSEVFHPIVLHGQTLGTLYIESDMRQWHARLSRYTGIVGVLMLGSALVAFLLSSRLQTVISETDSGSGKDDEDGFDSEELLAAGDEVTER